MAYGSWGLPITRQEGGVLSYPAATPAQYEFGLPLSSSNWGRSASSVLHMVPVPHRTTAVSVDHSKTENSEVVPRPVSPFPQATLPVPLTFPPPVLSWASLGPVELPPTSRTQKALVLDLDNTLICTKEDMAALFGYEREGVMVGGLLNHPAVGNIRDRLYVRMMNDSDHRPGSGLTWSYWGIRRPGLNPFLQWAFGYFRYVFIYTAGDFQYGNQLAKDVIFRDTPQPHQIFTRADMVAESKPLQVIVDSSEYFRTHLRIHDLVLVDDLVENFAANPRQGILIPKYNPASTYEGVVADDDALARLQGWFNQAEVVAADSVEQFDLTRIWAHSPAEYAQRAAGKLTFSL